MSAEEQKAVIRHWIAALNRRDLDVARDCFAPDHQDGYAGPHQVPGPEGVIQRVGRLLAAFDLHFEIEDLIAEGDRVAARFTVHGLHRGSFRGIQPTSHPITLRWASFAQFGGNKIVRSWGIFDGLELIEQLGVILHSQSG